MKAVKCKQSEGYYNKNTLCLLDIYTKKMKLLEFIVILGIFFKGHYVSAIKLSSNYHNRKLLVKGGDPDTKTAYVYLADVAKCTVTRVSAEKVATDASCGASIAFCVKPAAGKCPPADAISVKDPTDVNGVNLFTAPGDGAPEVAAELKDCLVVGFGSDDAAVGEKTSTKALTAVEDGIFINVTTDAAKLVCPADKGGAVVCGDKLAGILIAGGAACAPGGRAIKVGEIMSGAGGDSGSESPDGGEGGDKSTPAPGGSYAITSSMIITALPIIIITCLDH